MQCKDPSTASRRMHSRRRRQRICIHSCCIHRHTSRIRGTICLAPIPRPLHNLARSQLSLARRRVGGRAHHGVKIHAPAGVQRLQDEILQPCKWNTPHHRTSCGAQRRTHLQKRVALALLRAQTLGWIPHQDRQNKTNHGICRIKRTAHTSRIRPK